MAKNNHFDRLNSLLRSQTSDNEVVDMTYVVRCAGIFAEIEGAVAVVSDLRKGESRIVAGRFGEYLGVGSSTEPSIWERVILNLMTSEEQNSKFISELRFFQFLKGVPKSVRRDYYMVADLRFEVPGLTAIQVLHRMYYFWDSEVQSVRFALCLYSPLVFETPAKSYAVNSITGAKEELSSTLSESLLSRRERQVLSLIAQGMKSVEISDALNISIHTVNRHRQQILAHLRVKNSVEACRVARNLSLI
ncbi:MAG: helix-turn-helix domain-containing protein [Bacteroides sp.]|nr:helix-turn-helix domain-containing protein [Bacteroides sp.]